MLIRYDGAHPEIVVDELDTDTVITAGVPVEIPDELAARLLEQSTWSKATPTRAAAASTTATADTTDTGSN